MGESTVIDGGLLGEVYRVQDYIQVTNPQLIKIAETIRGDDEREIAEGVLRHVCRNFRYPLTWRGQPSTRRQTNLFEWVRSHLFKMYRFEVEREYGWLLPNQSHVVRYALCIDTACYSVTLLRIKGLKAHVALGAVLNSSTMKFVGLHAWGVVEVEGKGYVLETTIHPNSPGLIPTGDVYDTPTRFEVVYDEVGGFDEVEYWEDEGKMRKYARFGREFLRTKKRGGRKDGEAVPQGLQ